MGTLIDIFVYVFKSIWKFSGLIGILAIAFLLEIGIAENWRQEQMYDVLRKADLYIVSAEPVADESELQYKITVRNEGSNECNYLPNIMINYDDRHSYLDSVDLYSELTEKNNHLYISTAIPAKTEVTLYYKTEKYYEEEVRNAQKLSLQMSEYDSMNTAEYPLN